MRSVPESIDVQCCSLNPNPNPKNNNSNSNQVQQSQHEQNPTLLELPSASNSTLDPQWGREEGALFCQVHVVRAISGTRPFPRIVKQSWSGCCKPMPSAPFHSLFALLIRERSVLANWIFRAHRMLLLLWTVVRPHRCKEDASSTFCHVFKPCRVWSISHSSFSKTPHSHILFSHSIVHLT